jgi:hypothetical protein
VLSLQLRLLHVAAKLCRLLKLLKHLHVRYYLLPDLQKPRQHVQTCVDCHFAELQLPCEKVVLQVKNVARLNAAYLQANMVQAQDRVWVVANR